MPDPGVARDPRISWAERTRYSPHASGRPPPLAEMGPQRHRGGAQRAASQATLSWRRGSRSPDRQRVVTSGHCLDRWITTGLRQGGCGLRLEHPFWRVDRTLLPPRDQQRGLRRETFAIYQALRAFDQRQESGHRYTVFADSTPAINRMRSDALGPGQRFASQPSRSAQGSSQETMRSPSGGSRRAEGPVATRGRRICGGCSYRQRSRRGGPGGVPRGDFPLPYGKGRHRGHIP